MSFTNEIKNRISENRGECDYCAAARLAGLVRFAGNVNAGRVTVTTENKNVADCASALFHECLGIDAPAVYSDHSKLYKIELEGNSAEIAAEELCLGSNAEPMMAFSCCRRAFLAGAFLGGGSMNDPKKSYHLEFDTKKSEYALDMLSALDACGIAAKTTIRKGRSVVYVKEYESIAAVLGLIGADFAALELYSVSVEKEIRNDVNRKVNCENANLDKLAQAASKQLHAIMKIEKKVGLGALSDTLKEMAELRLAYPEDSLKELGERVNPPIGKSGVNHRLNRIIEFAEKL